MAPKIAHYRTIQGATRYARDLEKHWPGKTFAPVQHPRDFGFAVANFLTETHEHGIQSYAGKRPKGNW